MVGEPLVEGVAQVPAVGEVEAGRLDEPAFRTDALEEHDQLQLEEDDWVDGRAAALGVEFPRPLPNEARVQLRVEMAVEVDGGDQVLERNGDRLVEAAGFGDQRTGCPVYGFPAQRPRGVPPRVRASRLARQRLGAAPLAPSGWHVEHGLASGTAGPRLMARR